MKAKLRQKLARWFTFVPYFEQVSLFTFFYSLFSLYPHFFFFHWSHFFLPQVGRQVRLWLTRRLGSVFRVRARPA